MNIQFSGITLVRGSQENVRTYLAQQGEITGTVLHPWKGIILDNVGDKDGVEFLKKNYDVEIPPELEGKSKTEALSMIQQDPQKYMAMAVKLLRMIADAVEGKLDQKILDYIEEKKAPKIQILEV